MYKNIIHEMSSSYNLQENIFREWIFDVGLWMLYWISKCVCVCVNAVSFELIWSYFMEVCVLCANERVNCHRRCQNQCLFLALGFPSINSGASAVIHFFVSVVVQTRKNILEHRVFSPSVDASLFVSRGFFFKFILFLDVHTTTKSFASGDYIRTGLFCDLLALNTEHRTL